MYDIAEHRARQVKIFESYLKQMVQRHKDDGDLDCYIVFSEDPPKGYDIPHLNHANAKSLKLVLQANDSAIAVGTDFLDQSCVLVPTGPDAGDGSSGSDGSNRGERYIQFAFRDNTFYMELTNVTLFPAEAQRLMKKRSGFFYVRAHRPSEMPQDYWEQLVKDWNPVHKLYLYGDTHSAAEDMAFIFYNLWKFPVDWQFYYNAGKFAGGPRRDWEGDGPVK